MYLIIDRQNGFLFNGYRYQSLTHKMISVWSEFLNEAPVILFKDTNNKTTLSQIQEIYPQAEFISIQDYKDQYVIL